MENIRTIYGPLSAIFVTNFLAYIANFVLLTTVSIKAGAAGFSTFVIGLTGAAYFVGYCAGCVLSPVLIARVGHTRCFAALSGVLASVALMMPFFVDPLIWGIERFFLGLCTVGMLMVVESWLGEKAPADKRGQVLSIYMIVAVVSNLISQELVIAGRAAPGDLLFVLAAVAACLSLVPLSLSVAVSPMPLARFKFRPLYLFALSPAASAAVFIQGMTNAGFWSMSPRFIELNGFGVNETARFIQAAIIGQAVFQFVLGRWSDRTDRRKVMAVSFGLAMVAAILLAFLSGGHLELTLIGVFIYGGMALPPYAIALAHIGDQANPEEFVEVSSGAAFLYSIGAAIGPIPGSWFMLLYGPAALFIWHAILFAGLLIFLVYRMSARDRVPAAEREDFIPISVPMATTPELASLDPRTAEDWYDDYVDDENYLGEMVNIGGDDDNRDDGSG